jgi:cytochrome b561
MSAAASRYSNVAILLHWMIGGLIVIQILGGLYMVSLGEAAAAEKVRLFQLHKSFGITILLLSLVRLGWRLTHRPPPLPAGMPGWQRAAARATHWSFYALMIGVPLGGWAIVSASPYAASVPTYLFGVVPWPHLPFFDGVADRKALAGQFAEMHEIGAFSILGLLALHLLAVAKHMAIDHDNLFSRMMPSFEKD